MRLLFLFGIVGYAAIALLVPRASALPMRATPDIISMETAANRKLLQIIERVAGIGDVQGCETLSPIPLYESSPSLGDWQTMCTAFIRRDAGICGKISDTLKPDLRAFCFASFTHS